jgi:hypothetical protein
MYGSASSSTAALRMRSSIGRAPPYITLAGVTPAPGTADRTRPGAAYGSDGTKA